MKKYLVISIILLISVIELRADVKPRFFIATAASGDSSGKLAEPYLSYFETKVFNFLKDVYPCVEISSLSTITALLELERQRQLLGAGDDNAITNIGQALGCNYLISLRVSVINNKALITALCLDVKKVQAISRAMANVQHGEAGLDAVDNVSKQLIDGLKKYEICPFKGPFKIHVVSTTKDKQTEEYPVYCNKIDGIYKKEITIDNSSNSEWNLYKRDKYSTDGNVKFTMREETILEEQNDCYECTSGRKGGRTYYKKTLSSADVQGLSKDSEQYGIKVDDARIELTFLDNDTYTILIKAASNKGDKKEKIEEHAEGTCDNIQPNNNSINVKADVPLKQLLGPFKGNAQDDVLTEKSTIKNVDPNTKEETEIEYEFNLTKGK